MIKSVKVTNFLGESITLEMENPDSSGFFIRGISGLGPPKATINLTDTLTIDGASYNSSKAEEKNLVLDLGFHFGKDDDIELARYNSYKYFPLKKPLELVITTDNRVAKITGYVESNEPNVFSKAESTYISIICPFPYFQDEENDSVLFNGILNGLEFPVSNESTTLPLIVFGDVTLINRGNLYYTGDVDTGVLMTIHIYGGPVTDLTIYNLTKQELMFIDTSKLSIINGHTTLMDGDVVYISTVKGNKYISLVHTGTTFNIMHALDAESSWFQVTKGDNEFLYLATAGQDYVQLLIEYRILYEGA